MVAESGGERTWSRRLMSGLRAAFRLPLLRSVKVRLLSWNQALIHRVHQGVHSSDNDQAIANLTASRATVAEHFFRPATPGEWPELDVSAVCYNSHGWLDQFMESLMGQDYPLSRIHLRFVDNDSSDATVDRLRELAREHGGRFAGFHVHERTNDGFGAGHDYAIRQGKAGFCLVTNVDLVFEKETLTRLLSQAVADAEDTACWEPRQKPFEHPKFHDPVTLETNWCSHACILMRRAAYEQIGGYEHRIFMYGEDVELSYRFRAFGWRLRYCPAASVWHYTYEHERQIKPLQHFGSTLANAFIRLRYGHWSDVLGIAILYLALLVLPNSIRHAKRRHVANFFKTVANAPYFLRTRQTGKAAFPIRTWDYEMIRDGAFVELEPLPGSGPKVSFIVRSYAGRAPLLAQALRSIANQTWPNVQVVLAEDGGESLRPLAERFQQESGIELIFVPCPKNGRSFAGNSAMAAATGEYFVFLDDDDLVFPDHVEILMAGIARQQKAVAAYALSWEVLTVFEAEPGRYRETLFNTPPAIRQPFDRELIKTRNFIPIQAILFSRSLFDRMGGFDPELDYLEDWNLWMRYAALGDFVYVEKTTSLYRTPADLQIRSRRQTSLDEAYENARRRGLAAIAALATT